MMNDLKPCPFCGNPVNARKHLAGWHKPVCHLYVIKNIAFAACWTILAIEFNKWWIALFMLLTVSTYRGDDE